METLKRTISEIAKGVRLAYMGTLYAKIKDELAYGSTDTLKKLCHLNELKEDFTYKEEKPWIKELDALARGECGHRELSGYSLRFAVIVWIIVSVLPKTMFTLFLPGHSIIYYNTTLGIIGDFFFIAIPLLFINNLFHNHRKLIRIVSKHLSGGVSPPIVEGFRVRYWRNPSVVRMFSTCFVKNINIAMIKLAFNLAYNKGYHLLVFVTSLTIYILVMLIGRLYVPSLIYYKSINPILGMVYWVYIYVFLCSFIWGIVGIFVWSFALGMCLNNAMGWLLAWVNVPPYKPINLHYRGLVRAYVSAFTRMGLLLIMGVIYIYVWSNIWSIYPAEASMAVNVSLYMTILGFATLISTAIFFTVRTHESMEDLKYRLLVEAEEKIKNARIIIDYNQYLEAKEHYKTLLKENTWPFSPSDITQMLSIASLYLASLIPQILMH